MGAIMDHEIERVAQAFYYAEDDGKAWDREPEILKAEFRRYARDAIVLLLQARKQGLPGDETVEFSDAA
jgi:hypothetical protein